MDRLLRQNEMIENAHRTVLETEEVGMEITTELQRNREKIQSSRAKAAEFVGVTDTARRMLASMNRRENRIKMMMVFLTCVLIVAIIITVYYTVKK